MQSLSNETILDLVSSLYNSAKEQSVEVWSDVFKRLLDVFSSGPGSLSLYSPTDKRFNLFVSTMNPELVEEYNDYYQFISPFRNQILQMKTGDRFNRAENCSDKAFIKTELYQGYFKRQDVFNYEYRVLFKEGEMVAGVGFSRPQKMKNFSAREIKLMQLMIPHLRNAFQLYLKFSEIQRDKKLLFECFEKISQCVVVVNQAGKVVYLNECANKLIAAKDGLQIGHNRILAANYAPDTKKLKMFLQSVFESNIEKHAGFGGVLQVFRASGARPLSVFVSPFSENGRNIVPAEKLALVFINDPDQRMEDIEPVLARIYGLTPAESKIAAILTQGVPLNEICRMLGIKSNTIRTHLKRIFSKTETNRQSELVKLILNNQGNMKIITK